MSAYDFFFNFFYNVKITVTYQVDVMPRDRDSVM